MDNHREETVWLTTRDVAEKLGVVERTVLRWIRGGKLPALYIGGRTGYRIAEDAVDAFMLQRRVENTARDELAGKHVR